MSRAKVQFCPEGHDTFAEGRNSNGGCRICVNSRNLRYSKNRYKIGRILVDSYKNTPCFDCKQRYPAYVMQFDHLGLESKDFNICHSLTYSQDKICKEIAKCEVVCANCHAERTHNRLLEGVN